MRRAKASGMLGLVALAIIASPMAFAQDSGWYIGGNIGVSRAKIDDERITSGFVGQGFAVTSIEDDDKSTGWKAFLGYQFNKYTALEAGYFDLGKFGFKANTIPTGTLNGDIKLNGVNLDFVLSLPMTEKFSVFGRVGGSYVKAKDSFNGTGLLTLIHSDPKKQTWNIKFGGGLQYDFTRWFGMRAEAERYRVDDAIGNKGDIDLYSIGVLFKFGRGTPAPAPRATEKAIVMPPKPVAVPEPILVVVPVPLTQEYGTILDIEFEIDKDEIQREEKERLAVLGTYMTKYPETTALIEGHTDNVGSDEHNQQLSQHRAESVVRYMEETFQIAPSRLTAVGHGSARPIADNSTEEGKRKNRRINAVVGCVTDIQGLTVAPARITMALLIEFGRNDAEILPKYGNDLRKVADFLKANPTTTATVEGHTSNLQGSPAMVMEMSQRRAQNVKDYLVNNFGIERSRISTEGFGKSRRFAYNTSVEGRQENRRVNIIINYSK